VLDTLTFEKRNGFGIIDGKYSVGVFLSSNIIS